LSVVQDILSWRIYVPGDKCT